MRQVYHKEINSRNHIYVWLVNNSLDELVKANKSIAKNNPHIFLHKSEKRIIESFAINIILGKLFQKNIFLHHLDSGKPYINEAKHISISHSHKYIAIYFGDINIGIDIELPSKKIELLTSRFLSKKEKYFFDQNPSKKLACKLWGAKESILKCIGKKNIEYKDFIQIDFLQQKGVGNNKTYQINYKGISKMILTTAMEIN